ncbi:MAG: glucosidase [Actinomycetota bacterium]|nr:MAG: glucosidase [Actinomycetota bacterium]
MADAGSPEYGPEEAGPWYRWGPYLSERGWGSVREDYSADGDAWKSFPYDHARSRAYRWNEDGLAGLSDLHQDICLAMAFWNGRDDHLKERLFGLSGPEGNHGEDAKEYWWYLDATPSHAWLRWRYHYPQAAFPYDDLRATNARRDRTEPEYELLDTGVFDDDRYWSIDVSYAKDSPTEIFVRVQVTNEGPEADTIHVLPQLWCRDEWTWGRRHQRPEVRFDNGRIVCEHWRAGVYHLQAAPGPDGVMPEALFCDNETNVARVFGATDVPSPAYPKDGINDHIVAGAPTVNPARVGTKAAWHHVVTVPAGQTVELRFRLWSPSSEPEIETDWAGTDFDRVLAQREREADEFYATLGPAGCAPAELQVMRSAFAGMIWTKQFYRYDVRLWLTGDPGSPPPPDGHQHIRNSNWRHFDAYDVLSMPDAWEYPWFAAWDLAFHTVVFAHVDPGYAKYQLLLMLREWYMHPNGALPSYEWNFDDRNPPVHAWAAIRVFEIDGGRDHAFLERVFHKLLLNFTWWVNRVDADGNNVFEGGFLGLDNIGPIDRSHLPGGWRIEQADGTAWMAFYCLSMLRIALRLTEHNEVYGSLALKFLEHFAAITDGFTTADMWDPSDGFFYDQLVLPAGERVPLRVRSVVGVIPLLAAALLEPIPGVTATERTRRRVFDFMRRRGVDEDAIDTDKAGFVFRAPQAAGLLLTVVDPERLRRVLLEVLSEDSLLSPYGVRSLSQRHRDDPFVVRVADQEFRIDYEPAESTTAMYGGNSNWRGPVWFPINHLVVEALERYHMYLGDTFTVECPTGSGTMMTLQQVADELRRRLISLFLPGAGRVAPAFGERDRWTDSRWSQHPLFFEYFDGDTGAGLGASHQTGWTGLVADLIIGRKG